MHLELTAILAGKSFLEKGYHIVAGGKYQLFDLDAIHRREWLANIQIENFAVDGSFFIHIFVGDFSPDPGYWTQDMNLVGTHAVFSSSIDNTKCAKCKEDNQNHALVSGGVSLTTKLVELGLADLEPATVKPYLKQNLHWRVQKASSPVPSNSPRLIPISKANGDYVNSAEIPSLVINITATIVESPKDPAALPIWGIPELYESITQDKAGGYKTSSKI